MVKESKTSLHSLLAPQSLAVVGVSRKKESLGRGIFENLVEGKFKGNLYAVNPNVDHLGNHKVYPSIESLPEVVDLAVLVVGKKHMVEILEACGKKGVANAVLITAGYSELNEEGEKLEENLHEIGKRYGINLVGPNCMGIINTAPETNLNASFSPVFPPPGNMALASQSGSLGQTLLDYASSLGIGISNFVSLGNCIDLNECDLLSYWEKDPHTEIILLYIESYFDPDRFLTLAKKISRKKPILLLQGGRTQLGRGLIHVRTNELADPKKPSETDLQKAGVLRVQTLDDLLGMASFFGSQKPPSGKRVGILTNAGGPAILAADRCVLKGLELPPLSESLEKDLQRILSPEAIIRNPVDMLPTATPQQYGEVLRNLYESSLFDSILVLFVPPVHRVPGEFMNAIVDMASRLEGDKPILTNFIMSSGRKDLLESFRHKKRLPLFSFPEQAIDALALFTENASKKLPT